jgi:hypothetical protein
MMCPIRSWREISGFCASSRIDRRIFFSIYQILDCVISHIWTTQISDQIFTMDTESGPSSQAIQRQVRLQLTTRDGDIALPDNTGPILVPTGEAVRGIFFFFFWRKELLFVLTFEYVLRATKIRALHISEQFTQQ